MSSEGRRSAQLDPSRIRVVHFADVVNRHDFIHNVAAHCDPLRFEVSVVTLSSRGSLNADPGGIRVVDLGARARLWYPHAILALRRLLRREAVSILHSHHYEPSVLACLATLGLRTRIVIGRHYSDAIYRFSRGLRRSGYLGIETLAHARASAVVAPSTVVERILLEQGVPSAKVVRIPYGLDFSRFDPPPDQVRLRLEAEWPTGKGLRLLTVGRLHVEKGHTYLLAAMERLRAAGMGVRLAVVGDGSERDRLVEEAARRGLASAVRFLGLRTDVLSLMSAADAVVQPTLNEAFSQVMLEAMAMGRALVISDVGGVGDIVDDQVSGLVVPIGDASAIVSAVGKLADESFRNKLGFRAARVIRERLDVTEIAAQFEALYSRLADERRRANHAT